MVNSPRDGSLDGSPGEPALSRAAYAFSGDENSPLAPAAPSAAAPRIKSRLQISHIEPLPVSVGFCRLSSRGLLRLRLPYISRIAPGSGSILATSFPQSCTAMPACLDKA